MRQTLLLLACLLTSAANAQTTLKGTLLERYRAFTRAIQTKDEAFLQQYLAPDFTADLPGTHADRNQALEGLSHLMRDAKHLNWTWELSDLRLFPDGPTVVARGVMTASVRGEDNKWHRVKIAGTAEDTWVLNQNVWQQRRMRMYKISAWMDGKPLPLPASPFSP